MLPPRRQAILSPRAAPIRPPASRANPGAPSESPTAMPISRDAVLSALQGVTLPGSGRGLVEADLVRALTIEADRVRFVLEVDPAQGAALEPVRVAAEAAVAALPGVTAVSALLTAH
ncbi:MAG: iron-sulfur cluster assembly protein, partial [Amaricoccus sp.]|uniref:iron-sulfur cluster assembly protein n=1 Tax=Amaricoccus sp. TaxID=1872485 RepID=UPI003314AD62